MNKQQFKQLMNKMMKQNPSMTKHEAYLRVKFLILTFGKDYEICLKGGFNQNTI